jgi:mercuric reductase
MLVIGGNSVGLELGQLFARLGTRVTIAEALDRLAPSAEPEVSAAIEDVFDDEGIGILTAATVISVQRDSTGRSVKIRTAAGRERELAYSQILVAAGRRPVSGGLDLEAAGVTAGPRGRDRHRRVPAHREPADLGGRGRHRRPAVRVRRRCPGHPRRRQRPF